MLRYLLIYYKISLKEMDRQYLSMYYLYYFHRERKRQRKGKERQRRGLISYCCDLLLVVIDFIIVKGLRNKGGSKGGGGQGSDFKIQRQFDYIHYIFMFEIIYDQFQLPKLNILDTGLFHPIHDYYFCLYFISLFKISRQQSKEKLKT